MNVPNHKWRERERERERKETGREREREREREKGGEKGRDSVNMLFVYLRSGKSEVGQRRDLFFLLV